MQIWTYPFEGHSSTPRNLKHRKYVSSYIIFYLFSLCLLFPRVWAFLFCLSRLNCLSDGVSEWFRWASLWRALLESIIDISKKYNRGEKDTLKKLGRYLAKSSILPKIILTQVIYQNLHLNVPDYLEKILLLYSGKIINYFIDRACLLWWGKMIQEWISVKVCVSFIWL